MSSKLETTKKLVKAAAGTKSEWLTPLPAMRRGLALEQQGRMLRLTAASVGNIRSHFRLLLLNRDPSKYDMSDWPTVCALWGIAPGQEDAYIRYLRIRDWSMMVVLAGIIALFIMNWTNTTMQIVNYFAASGLLLLVFLTHWYRVGVLRRKRWRSFTNWLATGPGPSPEDEGGR